MMVAAMLTADAEDGVEPEVNQAACSKAKLARR